MNLLETRDLQFGYGKNKILENVHLNIPKGSIYGFLGKNGAGKSTTIKLLLGLEKPDAGTVVFEGSSIYNNRPDYYAVTGSLIEAPSPYGHLTAFENLSYLDFIFKKGAARIQEVLRMVRLTGDQDKLVKKFSMGMKQRLGIAMAIFSDPTLLILDEPFNGLDPEGVYEMRELLLNLHRDGKTIFFSSHILSDVQKISTHIGFLHQGKVIFEGSISDLLSSVDRTVILRTNNPGTTYKLCADKGFRTELIEDNRLSVLISSDVDFDRLLRTIVQSDIQIFSVQSRETTLEDAFLKFTSRDLYV